MHCRRIVSSLIFGLSLAIAVPLGSHSGIFAQDETTIVAAEPNALDAPLLLAPANDVTTTGGSHPPLGLPTLQWEPVLGATKYHVQVDKTPGFGQPRVDVETPATAFTVGTVTSFDPTKNSWPDGVYYWRVQAGTIEKFQTIWGPFSGPFRFVKQWDDDGEVRLQLLSPEADAVRAIFGPDDFVWTPMPGAASYLFEIATDEEFTNIALSSTTVATRTTPLITLPSNLYHWRVTPVDYRGNRAAASESRRFTVDWSAPPQPLAPTDASLLPFVPRFSWTAVEGARSYELRISTQPDLSAATVYVSNNTDFTPFKALANDQDYFWQVRAINQQGHTTLWSTTRGFRTAWNFAPKLLTPHNNSTQLSYPFFSWEPVPGAERYQIQIDESNNFGGSLVADEKFYNVPSYTQPRYPNGLISQKYYWQVRGVDAQGNFTPWSPVAAFSTDLEVRPNYVYPPYYFPPDNVNLPVHRDRSIGDPVFVWDSAHKTDFTFPVNSIGLVLPPDYYRLELDDDPAFGSPNFAIETAGLGAAPTTAHPFSNVQDGQIYFWRVVAYRDGQKLGGNDGAAVWPMRYAASAATLPLSPGMTPIPMYPTDRFESTAIPPVLGWQPVQGAARYEVEISDDPTFDTVVDSAQALYTNYVPYQGRHAPMPIGAYWWRVRALNGAGAPLGDWTDPRRFHLSADLVTGNPTDLVLPASSLLTNTATYTSALTYVASGANSGGDFALGNLHMATDRIYTGDQVWAIAFGAAESVAETVRYVLYIDIDHLDNSGAGVSPLDINQPIAVTARYWPEYALVITRQPPGEDPAGLDASDVAYMEWNGSSWNPAATLASRLGQAWYDSTDQAIQLLVPYTDIDPDTASGSMALVVVSANATGQHQAFIPAQAGMVKRMAWVSDMLTPLFPFDTPLSNPVVYDELPPLRWRMPYFDSIDGYQIEVARDASFTQRVELWETYEVQTSPFFELAPAAFRSHNAYGDNESYYWRVRIRHERFDPIKSDFFDYGPWSPAMRFKLTSLPPSNLALNTGIAAFMTPTFTWDRVEGASGYTIQIDDDANFGSPLVNQAVDGTSYTPTEVGSNINSLRPGTQYHWRVAVRRSATVIGQWSQTMVFTKSSLAPIPFGPLLNEIVDTQPTFRWSAVLTPTVEPRLAAPRYRLQVDDDPNFGTPKINIVLDATSYTPRLITASGEDTLGDGSWHWRVAIVDGNGNTGPYGPVQTFGLQHPLPLLLAPAQGTQTSSIPTLAWTPVDGAAYYEVTFADNEFFNLATKATTDNAAYTPTKALTQGTYHWRVQMFDADRNPGPIVEGQFTLGQTAFLPSIVR